ncbi:MAG: hypothetical protein PsegKO_06850 [Pseudohongiellaceae bacterium]
MHCQNHPNARAIDQCTSCEVPLCGQCASFVEDSVLCERCAADHESEKFVNQQTASQAQPDRSIQVDREETQSGGPRRKSQLNPVTVQIGIIAVCLIVLAVRVLVFSGQPASAVNNDLAAREQQMTNLAQCLIVFRQIGVSLAAGEEPMPAMTCPDNLGPNRVQRSGDDIIVTHPAPQFYGFSRIEVSRRDPEPRLIN